MAALPSNWHDAFQWLTQTWTDPAVPWASHRSGFLDKLGINDESADADVAELFRRVEEEFHTDAERHAALTDEVKRVALLPESFTAEHLPEEQPSEEQLEGGTDDEATGQGYSTDHEQAHRLGIPYWDEEGQRYQYYDESTGQWGDEPAPSDSQWDPELAAELPFTDLTDAEIAELFYAEQVPAGFVEAVAAGDVTVTAEAAAVHGTITDG